jgi:hypothetical protein
VELYLYRDTFTFYLITFTATPPIRVKFTLEQAMKAQRGSRGIALLFL